MLLRRRPKNDPAKEASIWPAGWDVPARFNFTRDVIEARGADVAARAFTYVDAEGIVDRRTFTEVAQNAARWAHGLRTRIPHPGETVLLVAGTAPATYAALLGALKGGLVVVPCPRDLRAGELAYRVRHAHARLVVADRAAEDAVTVMLADVEDPPDVLYLDDAATELRRYAATAPTEDTAATDRALLLYTAGTGAEPKAVAHTHAATWAARSAAEHWLDAQEGDLVWTTSHAGWPDWLWHGVLGPWSVGAEVVIDDRAFDPEQRLDLLQRLAVTVLCQPPTEYRAIGKAGANLPGALPRLRHAVSTGEALEAGLVEDYRDGAGITLRDGLTQAECGLLAGTLPRMPVRPGVLGVAAPGHDVSVIDASGYVVEAGEEGELALLGRPPTLFTEYLGAPEATAAAFRDGWYLTGDRCVREEDGSIRYLGRTDDVIVSAGRRIGPVEVEAAVGSHPLVEEVAAVASPDADRGAVVKAFVTLAPGAAPGDDLVAVLAAHVAEVASPHLAPVQVEVVEALPRTATGKLRRAELRRLEEERNASTLAAVAARAQAAAAAEAAARALQASERDERRRIEKQLEQERAEEEHQRLLHQAEEQRRIEAERDERARLAAAREAAERSEAERVRRAAVEQAHRDALERERLERETQEREVQERKARQRAAAAEAEERRSEGERAEQAEREAEAAAEQERAAAAAAQERAEREAEAAAEQERAAAAAAERQRVESEREAAAALERTAAAAAAEQERIDREAAAQRLLQEWEAGRRAEEEQRERAEQEAAEREAAERTTPPAKAAPDQPTDHDAPIPGLADRIRRYADTPPPPEDQRIGPVRPSDDDDL